MFFVVEQCLIQARRQGFTVGGAKNHKGHIFKMQYWIYAATGGQTWMGVTECKWGGGRHWSPRWRRPWFNLKISAMKLHLEYRFEE